MGPTNPTEEHFDKGSWGWDGTQWRKLPLLFGYSDRLAKEDLIVDAPAGTNTRTVLTVPAGYIYIVNCTVSMNYNTAVLHEHLLFDGTNNYFIAQFAAQPALEWAVNPNLFYVLKEGDSFKVRFTACVLNDALYSRCWGYKMAVT